jgi:hypothetical protein
MSPNPFDPNYVQRQQTVSLQAMAEQQNDIRLQAYQGQCSTWTAVNLLNRDRGLPIAPVPAMPRKIVVSDAGEWTEEMFPGLQPPVLPAPVIPPGDGHSLRASAGPDRLDQILAVLGVLNAKLDALAGKVGE